VSRHSTVTAQLASFVSETSFDDLPAAVVHDVKRVLADTVGCAVGGYRLDAGQIMVSAALTLGGDGRATILGAGARSSAAGAAFANGYLGNVLDADDTFLNSGHPALPSVFPALALAERDGLSGRDLIRAIAVGFDVGTRIGRSLVNATLDESGTPVRNGQAGLNWYAFCAASSAAAALDLDEDQVRNAFGVAAFTAPLNFALRWQSLLAGKNMMKYSPGGFICFDGVLGAELAQRGFTADPAVLDGRFCFAEQTGSYGFRPEVALADLGAVWWISHTSLKPYATGRFAQHAVGMFSAILDEHQLTAADIDRVEVETFEVAAGEWFSGTRTPLNQIDPQFSIPLAIAAVAHGHELGPNWLSHERVQDGALHEFARRVHVGVHPDAATAVAAQARSDDGMRAIPNRVRVAARGQSFTMESSHAPGDPWSEQTRLPDEAVSEKFRSYTEGLLPDKHADRALELIFALDDVDDVSAELSTVLSHNS